MDEFKKNVNELLDITFTLTKEELEAVDHIIPMTQELFDRIVEKCVNIDVESFFFRFIEEYPKFLEVYAERIEEEMN